MQTNEQRIMMYKLTDIEKEKWKNVGTGREGGRERGRERRREGDSHHTFAGEGKFNSPGNAVTGD